MHSQPKCSAWLAFLHMGVAHVVTTVGALVFSKHALLMVWPVPVVASLLPGTPSLAGELTTWHMQVSIQMLLSIAT